MRTSSRCQSWGSQPSRVTVASYGFDPSLCGIGGPANLGVDQNIEGIRVPPAPTAVANPNSGTNLVTQYLFNLASLKLAPRQRAKLTNISQLLTIGCDTNLGTPPIYPLVQNVTTPTWRFSDVLPITWAVRMVRQWPLVPPAPQSVLSTDSFAWRWSDAPALLFETAIFPTGNVNWNGTPDNYTALTGYTAPYAGTIPGEPVGYLGNITALDFPWNAPPANFEPIELEGPGALCFFALVPQTGPSTRAKITAPAAPPMTVTGAPEEAFVADWPAAIYWSVGGALEVVL